VGYLVEQCQGAGCTSFAQIATPAGTTYNDTRLGASTSYSYWTTMQETTSGWLNGTVSSPTTIQNLTTLGTTDIENLRAQCFQVAVSTAPLRSVEYFDRYGADAFPGAFDPECRFEDLRFASSRSCANPLAVSNLLNLKQLMTGSRAA
jgi:hypothetical protein